MRVIGITGGSFIGNPTLFVTPTTSVNYTLTCTAN